MRRDELFLLDILEAADRIAARIAGRDLASVTADEDLQDVILRRLTIIGEAACQLSEDLRSRHSEIPWKQAIGLRHRVTPGYFGLDWTIIWKTVTEDLPALRWQIAEVLRVEFLRQQ
ncbi:MAG: DUF86 domain-containing protein [Acidobacteria bacterium]|nr:DUF86 domain-containing protein [Acidobacteriota bacterium]